VDIVEFISTSMAPFEMIVAQKKKIDGESNKLSVDCKELV
jgi:hypothetical protein